MKVLFLILLLTGTASAAKKPDYDSAIARSENFLRQNRTDDAVIQAEIARDLKPNRPESYIVLSKIYLNLGEKDRALDFLLDGYKKCGAMPDAPLAEVHELSTESRVIVIEPRGKKSVLGTRGFKDAAYREKILNALKSRPHARLALAERFIQEGNVTDSFLLLEDFKSPAEEAPKYFYVRAKGFYLLGNDEKFEKAAAQALAHPVPNPRQLYELGKLSVLAGSDETAEQFLRLAQKNAVTSDPEFLKKIDRAVKHPEVFLNEDDGN